MTWSALQAIAWVPGKDRFADPLYRAGDHKDERHDMTAMEYRTFPRGGERTSVIGFGMGSIHEAADEGEIEEALEVALDAGVNFFDLAPSQAAPYAPYGRVLAPRRNGILTQMHLGAVYGADGMYGTDGAATSTPSSASSRA